MITVIPFPIPDAPGCASVHVKTTGGGPVNCTENAPSAIKGTHWAPTHGWQVFFWADGTAYRCRHLLCTEGERKPWPLSSVIRHVAEHHQSWEIVRSNPVTP